MDINTLFPEFYKHDPGNKIFGWWPEDEHGRQIRINVLTKIIKELEK